MTAPSLAQQIKDQALALGFSKVGVARVTDLADQGRYLQQWLTQGYQAHMTWMEDPRRQDIHLVLEGIQSVIVVALNYRTPDRAPKKGSGRISLYTRGRDYHKVLGRRLKALTRWLREQAPDQRHRWYVDTGPVNEKIWAQQAGVGWIGKNSLLLTRDYGSWVFLGVVLTTLALPPDPLHSAHCGTCTRCLEACPTGAILPGSIVDSNRCLAYHTLENPDPVLPADLDLQGWVVGCDLCQTCCPFNQRGAFSELTDFQPRPQTIDVPLTDFAHMSDQIFDDWSRGMALRRVKGHRLRRNATHRQT